ncbi:MAG TPA: hypothetical protein VGM54_13295 [Chthoniobacter sp.]|jgi:hypothetical protein
MKLIISIILLTSITANAGWFSHEDYKEPWQQSQQQLENQRQANGQLLIVCGVLGTGCVVLLVIGAAIGAKARKAVKRD